MDETLLKVSFLIGSHIAIMDIFHVHKDYTLDSVTTVNMYIHQLLVTTIIVGCFFVKKFFIWSHLLSCLVIAVLWQLNDGCIMSQWQIEAVPYTPADLDAIHGSFEKRITNHLFVLVPAIMYDFYKLLR